MVKYAKTHKKDEVASKEGVQQSKLFSNAINETIPNVLVGEKTTVIVEIKKTYEITDWGGMKHLSTDDTPELYIIDTRLFQACQALEVALAQARKKITEEAQLKKLDF